MEIVKFNFQMVMRGDYKMSIAVYIEDFDGIGFTKENNNVNKEVHEVM